MQEQYTALTAILEEVTDLQHAADLLEWDQQVSMPPGASQSRSYQLATLRKLAHQRFTSPETGRLLEALLPQAGQLDPDSDEARVIAVSAWRFEKLVRVPASLIEAINQAAGVAYTAWLKARSANNFALFQPHLEKIIDLRRQYAACFAPYDHVYDALLDEFEPKMKTAEVQVIFDALRPQQVALLRAIRERPQVDASFLHQPFDPQKQWDFNTGVVTRLGFDWEHGRLDKAPHPFSIRIGYDDCRMTTRVDPNFFNPAFFATLHETGHTLYELGVSPALDRTPLGKGASMALHESQSRLWENLVGRSRPFWQHFYPELQAVFPEQLGSLSLEAFYRGINRVQPSLIRVEADEASYNLHIMLRLELEIALMDGSLEARDLPATWNARMEEYLGLTPPDDARGVLQDVHWSAAMIGYFATYALGNVVSAQLWERIQQDIPDLGGQIASGEFGALLSWLRQNLHRHGAKFEPQALVERITGSPIDPAAYLRYLHAKFGEIYGL
jgi:carboxypeptidase Taq